MRSEPRDLARTLCIIACDVKLRIACATLISTKISKLLRIKFACDSRRMLFASDSRGKECKVFQNRVRFSDFTVCAHRGRSPVRARRVKIKEFYVKKSDKSSCTR